MRRRVASTSREFGDRELLTRLHARRSELVQAVLTRVCAISDPDEVADPEYVAGLRAAVPTALDYALAAIEQGPETQLPVPVPLLVQARLAARNGVGLDTVLRRYAAGHSLISRFLIDEADDDGWPRRLLTVQAGLLDRLLAVVTKEYTRETENHESVGQRRRERVRRLLAGELVELSELAYDFDVFHLGAIARGPGTAEVMHELCTSAGCRSLIVPRDDRTTWAWFGVRHENACAELKAAFVDLSLTSHTVVAVGEPAQGLAGWRLTHRQASAAITVARREPGSVVHYGDVALLASLLGDHLLSASLRQLYLLPLREDRDGGHTARETLRTYFAADRNVTSAAAALGVSRRTVTNRLRTIEQRLGRSLTSCAPDVEAALHLADLGADESVPVPTWEA